MFWNKKNKESEPDSPPKEPVRLGKGHPGTFDEPANRLEEVMVAFRNREVDAQAFLQELFNSDVLILPLHQDIEGSEKDSPTPTLSKSPTLFCLNQPDYTAIGLFTSPERTKPACELHPEFRFATAVQAGDFLLGLAGDFGIAINPYWDVNLEWSNEQVARIRGMLRRDSDDGEQD